MAKSNLNVIHIAEAHQWKILGKNSKGVEETKDTVPEVEAMGEMDSIRVFQGLVKEETNARRASLSLLAHIWMFAKKPENKLNLAKYVGKGDKKTGQLSGGLKDDYKLAEDLYFKQFNDEDHPLHSEYVKQLPKLNERSETIEEDGRHAYFVSKVRKAPSYANAKNLFLNYMAYVGHEPFTVEEETGELIGIEPPEVMRARVQEAKSDVPAPDNSWERRYGDVVRELIAPDDPTKPLQLDGSKLAGLVQDTKILLGELSRRLKHYEKQQEELAKVQAKYHPQEPAANDKGGNVPALSAAGIDAAQESARKALADQTPTAPVEKAEPVKQ